MWFFILRELGILRKFITTEKGHKINRKYFKHYMQQTMFQKITDHDIVVYVYLWTPAIR
jgi:hypothetical protein